MPGKTVKELAFNKAWCKGCGICVAFCPNQVLGLDDQEKVTAFRIKDCTYCRLCELRCPDFAIEVRVKRSV